MLHDWVVLDLKVMNPTKITFGYTTVKEAAAGGLVVMVPLVDAVLAGQV
jgi:hypothetical protein